MDPIDILFRAVGLFYVLAGWLGLRALAMDALLDKAIAAISMTPEPAKEAARRRILACFTVAIGGSGAALALLSSWAVPLFVANTVFQAAWIAGGRARFVDPDDDDAAGLRQLSNAAILYALATAGVLWLWSRGGLGPWNDPAAILGTIVAGAGLTAWYVHALSWKTRSPFAPDPDDEDDQPRPQRVLVDPAFGYLPLVDADTSRRFSHWQWLPEDLAGRIEEWDDVFQLSFDPDDVTAANRFGSAEEEAAYYAEAEAIAIALGAVYGAGNVAFGPGWYGDEEPEVKQPA